MDYSNTMDDICKNISNGNSNGSHKILIVFGDMIADMNTNKKFQSIVKELFIRDMKLNIFFIVIIQFYFPVPKDVRLTHYGLALLFYTPFRFSDVFRGNR